MFVHVEWKLVNFVWEGFRGEYLKISMPIRCNRDSYHSINLEILGAIYWPRFSKIFICLFTPVILIFNIQLLKEISPSLTSNFMRCTNSQFSRLIYPKICNVWNFDDMLCKIGVIWWAFDEITAFFVEKFSMLLSLIALSKLFGQIIFFVNFRHDFWWRQVWNSINYRNISYMLWILVTP